jgi:hypothetical protein
MLARKKNTNNKSKKVTESKQKSPIKKLVTKKS